MSNKKRQRPPLMKLAVEEQPPIPQIPRNLDARATITIDDKTFEVQADDLEKIADLGRGAYGVVEKMRHIKTDTVMAVKRITATVNTQEQVRSRCCKADDSSHDINSRPFSIYRNDCSWTLISR